MPTLNLLFEKSVKITDGISVRIPLVGEVLRREEEYYSLITMLTAQPIDFMVQLDERGVDFTTIDDYELFLTLFKTIRSEDSSLVFDGLNLSEFEMAVNPNTKKIVLVNKSGVVIDKAVHRKIALILRKINHLQRNNKKPANKEARDYMIERAKKKAARRSGRTSESQLEALIVALVNTSEFHYGYETIKDLSIYQFNESVRQVVKKIEYDNRMHGIYAGTVDASKLSQDELSWLSLNKENTQ